MVIYIIHDKIFSAMKKTLTILVLLLSTAVAFEVMAQNIQLTKFKGQRITGVDASGIFEIKISQGSNTYASISFPKIYEDNIVFNLNSDGVVEVGIKGKVRSHKTHEKFTMELVCADLQMVELSGACSAVLTTRASGAKLDLALSGASAFTTNYSIAVSGDLNVECSGTASISKGSVTAQKAYVDCSGASEIGMDLNIASSIEIDCSGSSSISLSGRAERLSADVSGASSGDLSALKVGDIYCDVSGVSKLQVNGSREISGEVSGASSVVCRGEAKISVSKSGAASVSSK